MKQHKLIFNHSFWEEVDDALEWYENISINHSLELESEILEYCKKIARNPRAFLKVAATKYRRVDMKKYPYKIVYRIENDEVFLTNLIHTSRSNKYISKRLK